MSTAPDIAAVIRDPRWLAHRYDEGHDAVHFVHLSRAQHRAATFIIEEYMPAGAERIPIRRADAIAAAGPPAPLHFIFHSAFCLSTLLARALDRDGVAMALKEPVILNDMSGWKRRGADPRQLGAVVDDVLTLLARPFAPGEAVIVKPSNILNALAPGMLLLRPAARALLLYAPLRVYLGSVARKGMDGRLWARELLVGQLKDGIVDLGFDAEQYLGQTDLQVAAVSWLAQHALFDRLVERFPDRVRTLDSELILARPAEVIARLSDLFGLRLDAAAVTETLAGPAFTSHSKHGTDFAGKDRIAEQKDAAALHADELDKVAIWAEAVAKSAGVSMELRASLLHD